MGLQGERGKCLGGGEMGWASEGVGKRFEPVGLWMGEGWSALLKDLERRLDYGREGDVFSNDSPWNWGESSLVWDEAAAMSLAWEEVKKGFRRVIDVLDLGRYAKART